MKYSAPIDGMRAIAILAVLVFHIYPNALKGGFIGVDVFFVLSGYLITSIILSGIQRGSFSLREFYLRRVQRLLPNIISMILTVSVLFLIFMPYFQTKQMAQHGIWALCNMSNIFVWQNFGDYWGGRAEWSPLTHTWSLGIEEQFYMIMPPLLILLCRYQRRNLFYWILSITIFSFFLYFYYIKINATSTFYLLPMRLWEMSLGSLLASFQNPSQRSGDLAKIYISKENLAILAWISLGVILWTTISIADFQRFHGMGLLIADLATVGLLYSITSNMNSKVCDFLSLPLMVGLGKMSYSIYIWHWPFIILGKTFAFVYGFSQTWGAFLGAIVGILCAALTYFKVECPLRDRGKGRPKRLWIIGSGFMISLFLLCYIVSKKEFNGKFKTFNQPSTSMELYNSGKKTSLANLKPYIFMMLMCLPTTL